MFHLVIVGLKIRNIFNFGLVFLILFWFGLDDGRVVCNRSLKLAPQRRSQRGQMQHTNAAAATALYDAGPANDAGDAVMARWLQSAGLQHLASPTGGNDQRHLPNLLMQVLRFP